MNMLVGAVALFAAATTVNWIVLMVQAIAYGELEENHSDLKDRVAKLERELEQ
jgi:hypothetical protein